MRSIASARKLKCRPTAAAATNTPNMPTPTATPTPASFAHASRLGGAAGRTTKLGSVHTNATSIVTM